MELDDHLSDDTIAAYLERSASPEDYLAASRHLGTCTDCAARVQAARAERRAAPPQATAEALLTTLGLHPPSELLERFAANETNAREHRQVEEHLALCARCRTDLTQLRAFRVEADREPAAVELTAIAAAARPPRSSSKLFALAYHPGFSALTAAAGALMVFVVVRPTLQDVREENRLLRTDQGTNKKVIEDAQQRAAAAEKRAAAAEGQTKAATERIERLRRQLARRPTTIVRPPKPPSTDQVRNPTVVALARGFEQLVRRWNRPDPANQGTRGSTGAAYASGAEAVSAEQFGPTAPVNTLTPSARPLFQWNATPGATHYVVVVERREQREFARSEHLTALSWQPAQPLPRGDVLYWHVVAYQGETVLKDYGALRWTFGILTDAEVKEYAPLQLQLAQLKQQLGLRAEARTLLQQLIDALPGTPYAQQAQKRMETLK